MPPRARPKAAPKRTRPDKNCINGKPLNGFERFVPKLPRLSEAEEQDNLNFDRLDEALALQRDATAEPGSPNTDALLRDAVASNQQDAREHDDPRFGGRWSGFTATDSQLIAPCDLGQNCAWSTHAAPRGGLNDKVPVSEEARAKYAAENGIVTEPKNYIDRQDQANARDGLCCLERRGIECPKQSGGKVHAPLLFVFGEQLLAANQELEGFSLKGLTDEVLAVGRNDYNSLVVHSQNCIQLAFPKLFAQYGIKSVTRKSVFKLIEILRLAADRHWAHGRADDPEQVQLGKNLFAIIDHSIVKWSLTSSKQAHTFQALDALFAWRDACPMPHTTANEARCRGVADTMVQKTGKMVAQIALCTAVPSLWFGKDYSGLKLHYDDSISGAACDNALQIMHIILLFDRSGETDVPIFTTVPEFVCTSVTHRPFYDSREATAYLTAVAPGAAKRRWNYLDWLKTPEASLPASATKKQLKKAAATRRAGDYLLESMQTYSTACTFTDQPDLLIGDQSGSWVAKQFFTDFACRSALQPGKVKANFIANGTLFRQGGAVAGGDDNSQRPNEFWAARVYTMRRLLEALRASDTVKKTDTELWKEAYVLCGYTVTPPTIPMQFQGHRVLGDGRGDPSSKIFAWGFPTAAADAAAGTPREPTMRVPLEPAGGAPPEPVALGQCKPTAEKPKMTLKPKEKKTAVAAPVQMEVPDESEDEDESGSDDEDEVETEGLTLVAAAVLSATEDAVDELLRSDPGLAVPRDERPKALAEAMHPSNIVAIDDNGTKGSVHDAVQEILATTAGQPTERSGAAVGSSTSGAWQVAPAWLALAAPRAAELAKCLLEASTASNRCCGGRGRRLAKRQKMHGI
jgi:hypothetical protein